MYKVYWTTTGNISNSNDFESMKDALTFSQNLRVDPCNTFITMACEDVNMVGKQGVSAVVNGKLPDGNNYEWKKRRI